MKAFLLALLLCAAPLLVPMSAAGQEAALEVNADAIKAVHVARLAGMDFFDGVVRLDQIAAVIVRVR